jgi:hypothetical protein
VIGAVALVALLAAEPAASPERPPAAEPIDVRVRLERPEVRLGEPFDLTIELRHRPAERYALPDSLVAEPFRVLAATCPRREEAGDALTTCTVRLALFELGAHTLPELVLSAATADGARELRIPGPSVTGAGILDPAARPEELGLKDLAPPAPLLVPNVPLAIGALSALLAGIAGWLGWRAWRRRARRGVEPPPPLPPHERFALQLDALALRWSEHPDCGREHFFRLSEHVREYLGAVSGQNALDLTSAELLARLSFQPDPRLDLAALRAFLESSDLVKFARAPAGGRQADEGLSFARSLLAATRPASPSPSAAGTGGRDVPPEAAA